MKVEAGWFDAVKLLEPERREDERGFFPRNLEPQGLRARRL
jgi:dTDP-4-dehydrorhamnose 3,5-epimerase-like enzyme